MSDIIFARPRHNYGSYVDLYRLVEVSGFPLIHFDEIDPSSDNAYIMTMVNGENQHGWDNPRARIILWDLEWRTETPVIPGVSEIWASDKWYSRLRGVKYVPMGSHADLNPQWAFTAGFAEQDYLRYVYDAAFLGYMVPRREQARHFMERAKVRLSPTSAWDMHRHFILSKSQTYVHVHQLEDFPCVPSLRLIVAAAYNLPFVSELITDGGDFDKLIMQTAYGLLPQEVRTLTENERCSATLEAFGNALHWALCHDMPFRRCVERAI